MNNLLDLNVCLQGGSSVCRTRRNRVHACWVDTNDLVEAKTVDLIINWHRHFDQTWIANLKVFKICFVNLPISFIENFSYNHRYLSMISSPSLCARNNGVKLVSSGFILDNNIISNIFVGHLKAGIIQCFLL